MMKKIVASLFDDQDEAKAAAERLAAVGVSRDDISLISDVAPEHFSGGGAPDYAAPVLPGAPALPVVPVAGAAGPILGVPGLNTGTGSTSAVADETVALGVSRLADWLASEGVDQDDAQGYAEDVRRGGTLVAVKCDDADVSRVIEIVRSDFDHSDRRG